MPVRKKIEHSFDETPQAIEYSVYIHLPANQNQRFWEKTSTTHDLQLALEQAEMLHYTQRYPRIEVIRKFFCKKRKKRVSETLRIFDNDQQSSVSEQNWLMRLLNLAF